MARRLEYTIATDASDGIKGVKQFSSAVKKAMKDVDDSFDDSTTSAQKLAKVLGTLAGDLETEMKQAARAADALSDALGPDLAGRADVSAIVADLNKMGLSFDEITADADALAASLKQLDHVQTGDAAKRLGDIEGASKRASSGVDEVGKSADSSKSALANMVGNAAQDVGSLGGISGSAGVAIGQMAEYMADAAGSGEKFSKVLKNFALVAGPIALIAAAIEVATGVMGEMAERAAESEARVESFGDAMGESANDAVGLADALRADADAMQEFNVHASDFGGLFVENLSLAARQLPIIGGLIKEAGVDIVDIADKAGISFYDMAAALDAGGLAGSEFNKQLLDLADSGKITEDELEAMLQFIDQYGADARDAAQATSLLNVDLSEADALLQEIVTKRAPLKKFTAQWNTLFKDLRDGTIDTKEAADAINFLAEQLGIAPSEVISMALDETADAVERLGGAHERNMFRLKKHNDEMKASAEAAADYAVELLEAQEALDEMASPFKNLERGVEAMSTAFELKNAPLDALNETKDFEEGLRDLVKFIKGDLKGAVPDIFDVNDVNAKPMLDKIASLRGTVQQRISEAFASGGPGAAQATADAYVKQFVDSLDGKISAADIETLWGIDDLQASIKVAVDQKSLAEAQILLDILTGITGDTAAEKIWLAQVKLDLAAGKLTPQAAQKLIADQLGEEGLTVDASVVPNTADAIAGAQRFIDAHGDLDIPTSVENPSDASVIGARNSAQNTLNRYPATLPVVPFLDTRKVTAQARAFRSFFEGMDTGGTASGFGGIAGERGPEILNRRYLTTGPTYVPPGTKVTSRRQTERILRTRGTTGLRKYDSGGTVSGPRTVNINVSAGVIGNRYDVNRALRKAAYENARLLGVRP